MVVERLMGEEDKELVVPKWKSQAHPRDCHVPKVRLIIVDLHAPTQAMLRRLPEYFIKGKEGAARATFPVSSHGRS